MLDYIRDAESIKLEGPTEDIEVKLKDGKYVFAQSKATMTPDDNTNAIRDLSKALETLSEADATGKARELLLVTNRTDPLHDESSMRKFANPYSLVPYNDLPETCQSKIRDICSRKNYSLQLDRFSVMALEFPSGGNAGSETVKARIAEFLVDIDPRLLGLQKKMLDRWRLQFDDNAVEKDRHKNLSKKEMIWALIVLFCEELDDSMLNGFDDAEAEEVRDKYSDIVDWHSERFDMVCRVLGEYEQYKRWHPNRNGPEVQKSFIEDKQEEFASDFDLDGLEPQLAVAVRKITIERILQQQRKISKVKEAVQL